MCLSQLRRIGTIEDNEGEISIIPVCGEGKKVVQHRPADNITHTERLSLIVCIQDLSSLFMLV